jgi:hypothetical protein
MSKTSRAVLDYCADLLSDSNNESFMRALFRRQKGEWVPVSRICIEIGIHMPPARGPGVDLAVTWLDEPSGLDGYASVVFFSARGLWSNIAIYNRDLLLRRE